jgi:ABC-type lipoprotein release transport system permease subunit
MLYFRLGFRNLWRNPLRSLISMAGIAGSVFLCCYLANIKIASYQSMIDMGVEGGPGHLVLYHPKWLIDREVHDLIPIDEALKVTEALKPFSKRSSHRLYIPALAQSPRNSEGVMVIGMELQKEILNHPLLQQKVLIAGTWDFLEGKQDALIGSGLAKKMGLGLGKKFVLMVQDKQNEIHSQLFRIQGIIETGLKDMDRNTVILPLKNAQSLLKIKDQIHETAILLNSIDDLQEAIKIAQSHTHHSLVYPWDEAIPQLVTMINLDKINGIVLAVFLFLIVGIGTVNSLCMSVMERTREFGVMRAIGTRQEKISLMVVMEGLVLSLLGIVIGLIFCTLLSLYTQKYGIDLSSQLKNIEIGNILLKPIIYTGWNFKAMGLISFSMLILGLFGSLYPAILANRVSPSEAMR